MCRSGTARHRAARTAPCPPLGVGGCGGPKEAEPGKDRPGAFVRVTHRPLPARAAASSILKPCNGAGERPSFRARNWCRAGRRSQLARPPRLSRPASAQRGRAGMCAGEAGPRRPRLAAPPDHRTGEAPRSPSYQPPAGLGCSAPAEKPAAMWSCSIVSVWQRAGGEPGGKARGNPHAAAATVPQPRPQPKHEAKGL